METPRLLVSPAVFDCTSGIFRIHSCSYVLLELTWVKYWYRKQVFCFPSSKLNGFCLLDFLWNSYMFHFIWRSQTAGQMCGMTQSRCALLCESWTAGRQRQQEAETPRSQMAFRCVCQTSCESVWGETLSNTSMIFSFRSLSQNKLDVKWLMYCARRCLLTVRVFLASELNLFVSLILFTADDWATLTVYSWI